MRGGGHFAEIRLLSGDPKLSVNPLYVPEYPTIEPYEYDLAKHGAFYGTGVNRWLDAGYTGHMLCFPYFGPPSSPDEVRNGLGSHGEALAAEWKQTRPPQIDSNGVTLYYAADLPHTRYRVERSVSLLADATVVNVEEWIENLADFDRPFDRVEHVIFGTPFVATGKNMLDLSGTRGLDQRGRAAASSGSGSVEWPSLVRADDPSLDLRPFQVAPKTSVFRTILADGSRSEGYFTMYNSDYQVLVGYVFPTADNPWICDWQENGSAQATPRLGKMIARGIEFGTAPFDEGLRRSVERGSVFGTPAYRWINGRQRLKTTFTIFLAQIPAHFEGVRDVQLEAGRIVITERGAGRQITLPTGHQQ